MQVGQSRCESVISRLWLAIYFQYFQGHNMCGFIWRHTSAISLKDNAISALNEIFVETEDCQVIESDH